MRPDLLQQELRCIPVENDPKRTRSFVELNRKIYRPSERMQSDAELQALLNGSHPLSGYFILRAFLVMRGEETVGRFALTTYDGDPVAYFGFFECLEDEEAADFLFGQAEHCARQSGHRSLVGPMNATFWIGYRLKLNHFDRAPYTGEPYNPPYYRRFLERAGFEICDRYTSSIYPPIAQDQVNPLLKKRYETFLARGIRIESPLLRDWDRVSEQLYELLTALYREFPVYKHIEKSDFLNYFSVYRRILNLDMVKMAYDGDRLVGFFIAFPDYGSLVYRKLNLFSILRILAIKRKPRTYILLYLGVDPAYKGLGSALSEAMVRELRRNGATGIGALTHVGNVTSHYANDWIEDRYEYALWRKDW
ncbi:MAG: GNAT family N-acetyltransferase [Bacillota bacterium]|nr:GNAT family N-acetyltransferase [Bacillota bacterium]